MKTRGAVLVTGASSGIGEATAIRLSESGFRVFGGFRKDEDAQRLSAAGISPVLMDVADEAGVKAARDEIAAHLDGGGLEGLVNNAGVPAVGPIELTPISTFRHAMEVNYFGVLSVTQAFLPLLRKSTGRIIMMSSISGLVSMPFMAPYTASKFALEALSDSLRLELAPEQIDVVLIEPGPIATRMWDRAAEQDLSRLDDTPYERPLKRFRAVALKSGRSGLPAETVAREVARVLTTRRPPIRVALGAPTGRLQVRLVRWLPDRLVDSLILSRWT